ncbi:MAG: hypothetical protein Q6353_021520 [Candidatus Sigynarchaeum springense]
MIGKSNFKTEITDGEVLNLLFQMFLDTGIVYARIVDLSLGGLVKVQRNSNQPWGKRSLVGFA